MPFITTEITIVNRFRDIPFFVWQEAPKVENAQAQDIVTSVFYATEAQVEAQADGTSSLSFTLEETPYYVMLGTKITDGDASYLAGAPSRQIELGSEGSVLAATSENGHLVWDEKVPGAASTAGK